MITVMKFGGTSVKDGDAISRAIEIIRNKTGKLLIVVSATSGTTDTLQRIIDSLINEDEAGALEYAEELRTRHLLIGESLGLGASIEDFVNNKIGELSRIINSIYVLGEVTLSSKDLILSFGEQISSYMIFHALLRRGIAVRYQDSRKLVKTDSRHTEALLDIRLTEKLIKEHCDQEFKNHNVIIVGGYIGSDSKGRTTTLGRGGSDYSAAIFASSLNAKRLEIWTDVDGILTSDPRMVKTAKLINNVTFSEAAELAFFGAKVLHPKTIHPAVDKDIPVYVLNTFKPEQSGTMISHKSQHNSMVKAIAFRDKITVINITSNRMLGAYGFLGKVFEIFSKHHTSVDIVTTSEVSISLTIDDEHNIGRIREELKSFSSVKINRNQAIISAIGEGIRDTAGISAKFFGVLRGINISMVSVGASEINLSIVVNSRDLAQAVHLLHNEFFDSVADVNGVFQEIN